MARRRRFSAEPFGPTVERLMSETGVTYRALAEKTNLSIAPTDLRCARASVKMAPLKSYH